MCPAPTPTSTQETLWQHEHSRSLKVNFFAHSEQSLGSRDVFSYKSEQFHGHWGKGQQYDPLIFNGDIKSRVTVIPLRWLLNSHGSSFFVQLVNSPHKSTKGQDFQLEKWRRKKLQLLPQSHLSVFSHFQLSSFLHFLTTLFFNWHLTYHLLMVGSVLGDGYHLPTILFARCPDTGFPRWLSWRRQWHPTPVLLPGKSHGRRSLVGCSSWGR